MNENFEYKYPVEQEKKLADLKERVYLAHERDKEYENYEKIAKFGQFLLNKYPNCKNYLLFHILIGSTVSKELPLFDFPGEDSVEKFIKEQL